MAAFNLVFALLLCLCVVHGGVFQSGGLSPSDARGGKAERGPQALNGTGNEIPPLCAAQSVTVSCAALPAADDSDGLLPHPGDCRLFYYCLLPDLPPVCRQCPADLYFNPEKRVCDNPKDSGCSQPALFV